MISTSLGQAVAAFSKALNSLRQKYIEDFAASLREPFNRRKLSAEWINEKIASLRRDFAAEFVNTASVPVIRALSPGSEQSTVERLSSVQIEFRSLASAAPAAADRGDGGRAMLRAVVGAGLGAAAALILVTMQIHQPLAGPARPPARDITHPRGNGTSSDGSCNGRSRHSDTRSQAPCAHGNAAGRLGLQRRPAGSAEPAAAIRVRRSDAAAKPLFAVGLQLDHCRNPRCRVRRVLGVLYYAADA